FARALTGATAATAAAPAPRPSSPAVGHAPVAAKAVRRRVPAGLAFLLIGFLIGVGALFAWKRGGHAGPNGPRVIAVLPFENQGDSTQEYFADGITDEVRGKLAALPGLQVIASGSSRAYRHTDKPLVRIASELGADYLLMAKVRWAKNPDGSSQVRVSPELVAIADGKPTTRWQQAFDAALTNVFKVQADIAGQVAEALDVALADSVSRQLAARPTENLPAYDAFLRGEQLFITQGANDAVSLRRAIAYYQQAIALDSTFALAWARMSRAQSLLWTNGVPEPALGEAARQSAERAIALDPKLADARASYAGYWRDIRGDPARARQELEAALRLDPRNASALGGIAVLDAITGQWDSALAHAREATRLDPLSGSAALRLGNALRKLGRYQEARTALDAGLARIPGNMALMESRVLVELRAGDLDSARAVLRNLSRNAEAAPLVAYFGNYWDLYWVLDDAQQQLLLTLSPSEFDGDRATWALVMAQTWWTRGDHARARAWADTARIESEQVLRVTHDDPQRVLFLGLAQAYLGQKAEAIRNAERGAASVTPAQDALSGAYFQHQLARVYVLTGEYEKAITTLEPLLRMPYDISPGWLRIDPNFAPLRGNPRFEKLIAGTA
ncbi:MAG TPA: tetratricopeptide repeat protein, partial [Gemmatimonadales bacterium]|nr:tetratricopeptide repeat protein [Gemmatimonadales bacterium]